MLRPAGRTEFQFPIPEAPVLFAGIVVGRGGIPSALCASGSIWIADCGSGPNVGPRRLRTATAQVGESQLGRSSQLDDDGLSCDGHAIADGELLALPGFDRAVDQHATFTDELFRFAATADEPAEFEELAKLDGNLAHGDGAFVA